jgi:2-polyprenyl-3-methyl-5-hydroxy-6-metoxy-1,4-benzoquinol methylase
VYLYNSKLDKTFYRGLYSSEYYKKGGVIQSILEALLTNLTNKIQNNILLSYFRNEKVKKVVLDVGCGEGNFLKGLNKDNFIKYGLDLKNSKKFDNFSEIQVYKGDFLNTKFKKKFDVIVLLHVLEHLQDPVKVLNKVKFLLNRKGIVLLSTPNTDSFGFKLGRQNWFHLDPPYHTVLFNKDNMNLLCEKTGLKIIDVKNDFYQFPLDLFWSIRNSKKRYLYYIFYLFAKFLSKECLTYVIVKR